MALKWSEKIREKFVGSDNSLGKQAIGFKSHRNLELLNSKKASSIDPRRDREYVHMCIQEDDGQYDGQIDEVDESVELPAEQPWFCEMQRIAEHVCVEVDVGLVQVRPEEHGKERDEEAYDETGCNLDERTDCAPLEIEACNGAVPVERDDQNDEQTELLRENSKNAQSGALPRVYEV